MGKNAIKKAFRPNNIGARGMVVSVDVENMEWLCQLLDKYFKKSMTRKALKIFSWMEAIKVIEEGKETSLTVITPKSNPGLFQIDYYVDDNEQAEFSLQMNIVRGFADFKNLTPKANIEVCKQVANFVVGVCAYEYLMHTERSSKTDTIAPFDVFGETLV